MSDSFLPKCNYKKLDENVMRISWLVAFENNNINLSACSRITNGIIWDEYVEKDNEKITIK